MRNTTKRNIPGLALVLLIGVGGIVPSVFARENFGPPPDGQFGGGMGPGPGDMGPGPGGMGPGNDQPSTIGTATYEVDGETKTEPQLELTAAATDQSALRVRNGGQLTVGTLKVQKTGDVSNEQESNFFSLNAAITAWAGSRLVAAAGTISTDAEGANAVFAWGEKSYVYVKNLTIETRRNSSRGLDATYGGTIEGENLIITTAGAHCAALATDRGEGNVAVKQITATTHGEGSPGIYSTGDIRATAGKFVALGAEAAVIEGKNSITVTNCEMVGNVRCGVMLYQSFSGDAGTGTSVYTMDGGSLTANAGPVFFITNTRARILLRNATLRSQTGVLISAGVDRWGIPGHNGGEVTVTAEQQQLTGNVEVNDISSVSLILNTGCVLTGALNPAATAGQINLALAAGAIWDVTADSSVDNMQIEGTTVADLVARIKSNGHTVYYRNKSGLLSAGGEYALDHGGKLVFRAAPEVDLSSLTQPDGNNSQWGPPPPDGNFGGGMGPGPGPGPRGNRR